MPLPLLNSRCKMGRDKIFQTLQALAHPDGHLTKEEVQSPVLTVRLREGWCMVVGRMHCEGSQTHEKKS